LRLYQPEGSAELGHVLGPLQVPGADQRLDVHERRIVGVVEVHDREGATHGRVEAVVRRQDAHGDVTPLSERHEVRDLRPHDIR
jgi:hypothetical protein